MENAIPEGNLTNYLYMLYIRPSPLGEVVFEIAPEVLHTGVVLQFACRLNIFDAVFGDALCELVEDHGVDALVLVFVVDGDKQQVEGIVLFQGFQDMDEAEGEERALGLLHGLGERGQAHAEADHLLVFIEHDGHIVDADITEELFLEVL